MLDSNTFVESPYTKDPWRSPSVAVTWYIDDPTDCISGTTMPNGSQINCGGKVSCSICTAQSLTAVNGEIPWSLYSLTTILNWKQANNLMKQLWGKRENYHITYGPGVSEHSAGNRINALVQYRFLLSHFAVIVLSKTGNKRHVFAENI